MNAVARLSAVNLDIGRRKQSFESVYAGPVDVAAEPRKTRHEKVSTRSVVGRKGNWCALVSAKRRRDDDLLLASVRVASRADMTLSSSLQGPSQRKGGRRVAPQGKLDRRGGCRGGGESPPHLYLNDNEEKEDDELAGVATRHDWRCERAVGVKD